VQAVSIDLSISAYVYSCLSVCPPCWQSVSLCVCSATWPHGGRLALSICSCAVIFHGRLHSFPSAPRRAVHCLCVTGSSFGLQQKTTSNRKQFRGTVNVARRRRLAFVVISAPIFTCHDLLTYLLGCLGCSWSNSIIGPRSLRKWQCATISVVGLINAFPCMLLTKTVTKGRDVWCLNIPPPNFRQKYDEHH